mmetsp:Transcript_17729/g.50226  ORF Transcript_17729/g.50226 Transcript_17729/m.50226 type:complete len:643 (+) Transcript_17729:415-2343(+)
MYIHILLSHTLRSHDATQEHNLWILIQRLRFRWHGAAFQQLIRQLGQLWRFNKGISFEVLLGVANVVFRHRSIGGIRKNAEAPSLLIVVAGIVQGRQQECGASAQIMIVFDLVCCDLLLVVACRNDAARRRLHTIQWLPVEGVDDEDQLLDGRVEFVQKYPNLFVVASFGAIDFVSAMSNGKALGLQLALGNDFDQFMVPVQADHGCVEVHWQWFFLFSFVAVVAVNAALASTIGIIFYLLDVFIIDGDRSWLRCEVPTQSKGNIGREATDVILDADGATFLSHDGKPAVRIKGHGWDDVARVGLDLWNDGSKVVRKFVAAIHGTQVPAPIRRFPVCTDHVRGGVLGPIIPIVLLVSGNSDAGGCVDHPDFRSSHGRQRLVRTCDGQNEVQCHDACRQALQVDGDLLIVAVRSTGQAIARVLHGSVGAAQIRIVDALPQVDRAIVLDCHAGNIQVLATTPTSVELRVPRNPKAQIGLLELMLETRLQLQVLDGLDLGGHEQLACRVVASGSSLAGSDGIPQRLAAAQVQWNFDRAHGIAETEYILVKNLELNWLVVANYLHHLIRRKVEFQGLVPDRIHRLLDGARVSHLDTVHVDANERVRRGLLAAPVLVLGDQVLALVDVESDRESCEGRGCAEGHVGC